MNFIGLILNIAVNESQTDDFFFFSRKLSNGNPFVRRHTLLVLTRKSSSTLRAVTVRNVPIARWRETVGQRPRCSDGIANWL